MGLGDAKARECRDSGTPRCGTRKRCDSGTWDVGTRGRDKRTTPDFCAEFCKVQFSVLSRKVLILYAGAFVCRLVADDFQRSWFGLIRFLAYVTVKALGT